MIRPPLEAFPDDRGGEPGQAVARDRLREAGVEPHAWSNGPGDTYAAHEHPTTKLLICAVELTAGDGFVLPAGVRHAAVVGPRGCTCLEGHRPAG